jgi:menaquinone-dependent protoporphyrinogen oxidase
MNTRILIVYATRSGSTREVAEVIGATLEQRGADADVREVAQVRDLASYSAVIVGSAIRGAKWLPEALGFVNANRDALSRVPLAYFQVCMTLMEDTPETRAKARTFLEPVCAMIQPLEAESFAGKIEYRNAPFVMRALMRLIRTPEGDRRDWNAIRDWAGRVYERFSPPVGARCATSPEPTIEG